MVTVPFIPATAMDGMPDVACLSGPSTSGSSYPGTDIDAFDAVSGVCFANYTATADHMLTPVSSAGSPPMTQKQQQKMTRTTYEAGGQGPTLPNTSKLYYTHDMSKPNSSPSPMAVHPSVTEGPGFDMTTFMATSSPYHSNHPSPRGMDVEMPPPIDPYLGSYGVSGGDADEQFGEYPAFVPMPVTPAMHNHLTTTATAGPLLTQAFHPRPAPRFGMIEDLREPNWALHGGFPPNMSPGRRPAPRKKTNTPRKSASRATPKQASIVKMESRDGILGSMAAEEDGEKEELLLSEDAPEDEKYLFQLRKDHIADKGKGMWEELKSKYTAKHKGTHEKAALQMKVSRAVSKYGMWPKKEDERLIESFHYIHDRLYNLILGRMKELGGCKCWDWKPQHVEHRLVKLGLIELTPDEKTGIRQRKKNLARRRAGTTGAIGLNVNMHGQPPAMHHTGLVHPHPGMHHPMHPMTHLTSHNGAIMNNWVDGLGVLPPHMMHHSVPLSRQASYDSAPGGLAMPMGMTRSPEQETTSTLQPVEFTPEEHENLLDSLFKPHVKLESSLSPPAEDDDATMDLLYEEPAEQDDQNAHNLNAQQSERVVRQACEQMIGRIGETKILAVR